MEKEKVTAAPGITAYREPLGVRFVAFYSLDDDGGSTLIDAGIPGTVTYWLDRDELQQPVKRLIITHADADHIGDAGALQQRFAGLELLCHAGDKRWIETHQTIVQERYAFSHPRYGVGYPDEVLDALLDLCGPDVQVTRTLSDGEQLAIGGRTWQVLHVPGHSPGHIVLWSAADGILILGDAVLGFGPPNVETGKPSMPATHHDAGAYLKSIDRLAALPVRLALSAHWNPMDGPAFQAFLDQSRRRVDEDMAYVLEACTQAPQSFAALLAGINARFREWDPAEDMGYIFALDGAVQLLLAQGRLHQSDGLFHAHA